MPDGPFYVGNAYVLTVTFKDISDALADPTDVQVRIKHPVTHTVEERTLASGVTRASEGVFKTTIIPDAPGRWGLNAKGTGAVKASHPDSMFVEPEGA